MQQSITVNACTVEIVIMHGLWVGTMFVLKKNACIMHIAYCMGLSGLYALLYKAQCLLRQEKASCHRCHWMKVYDSLTLHPSCLLNEFESLRTSLYHILASLVQGENMQKIESELQPKLPKVWPKCSKLQCDGDVKNLASFLSRSVTGLHEEYEAVHIS